ncbi:MAG: hypothetical protein NVSMB6_23080 [Burkholderiaceae bacterium]
MPLSQREQQRAFEQREAQDRKWESFCKPRRYIDQYGVTRLQYAHSRCEFGRTEDDDKVMAATVN